MSELARVAERARACARLFRLGGDVEAGLDMVEVVEGLIPFFDAGTLELKQQGSALLMQMFACQERQDWIGLADLLQYDLADLIAQVSSAAR